jgi:hypothetical protein
MSSYDQIAASLLHSNPPPHNYIVDVVEKDDEPGNVYLRVFADDINSHPDSEAYDLATWLTATLNRLNQWTVGTWTWEMAEKPK